MVGEFGIAYASTGYPQPWYDENGGVYPVYHVIKGLSALRGQPLIDVTISRPRELQAIAVQRDGEIELWLANLTDQSQKVDLKGSVNGHISILSAATFEEATQDVSAVDSLAQPFAEEIIDLPPYAVGRLKGGLF
jgi:D-apionolactonase